MLGTVMRALGAFRYGVFGSSYQEQTRKAAYRWEQQDRLGRNPAQQFLGPDAKDITLQGIICPHYRGGLRQVEVMRAIAHTGAPLMMVDGLGWVWLRWVIVEVTETAPTTATGSPARSSFGSFCAPVARTRHDLVQALPGRALLAAPRDHRPLDGVSATAAARGVTGALWPITVTVADSTQGIIEIDGRGVGRVWTAGVLWLDLRLARADRVVHSDTFGIVVLDAAACAGSGRGRARSWTRSACANWAPNTTPPRCLT
ncbi:MAG: hypothetical protein Kow0013_23330 [Pararhodobacter sp.]